MKKLRSPNVRGNVTYRDWTQGNIFRNLVSLSWPIIVSNSFNLLGPVIDMVWVGKLGAASIAGVGVASMAVMSVTSARMGLTIGTRAMVARFVGAGDADGANLNVYEFVSFLKEHPEMAKEGREAFLAKPPQKLQVPDISLEQFTAEFMAARGIQPIGATGIATTKKQVDARELATVQYGKVYGYMMGPEE